MNWLSKLNQSPGRISYPLRLLIYIVIGWGFAIIFFPYMQTHPGVHALHTVGAHHAVRDTRTDEREGEQ
jgi:hypothetical protein